MRMRRHHQQHEDTGIMGVSLLVAVLAQVALGISNVWLQWPLGLAVLHNTGAAILLAISVYTSVQIQSAKH